MRQSRILARLKTNIRLVIALVMGQDVGLTSKGMTRVVVGRRHGNFDVCSQEWALSIPAARPLQSGEGMCLETGGAILSL